MKGFGVAKHIAQKGKGRQYSGTEPFYTIPKSDRHGEPEDQFT